MEGRFEKGREKTGGRKKGSLNKATIENKNRMEQFFNDVFPTMMKDDWPQLTPKDRFSFLATAMGYVFPKLSSVDVRQENKVSEDAVALLEQMCGKKT